MLRTIYAEGYGRPRADFSAHEVGGAPSLEVAVLFDLAPLNPRPPRQLLEHRIAERHLGLEPEASRDDAPERTQVDANVFDSARQHINDEIAAGKGLTEMILAEDL